MGYGEAILSNSTNRKRLEEKTADMTRQELSAYNRPIKRKMIIAFFAATIVLSGLFIAVNKYYSLYPYAISLDNSTICYVDDKESAREVIMKLVNNAELEGAEIKAISTDDAFRISRADSRKVGSVMNVDEAVECIKQAITDDSQGAGKVRITVVSTRVEEHSFTPETEYIQDDGMLAGQQSVIQEGKDGHKTVLVTYTTIDGNITNTDEELVEMLDEGQPEKIARGTLGLPTGADWKTYDGNPVFNSGESLVTTAQKYIGKVPYKWGGRSLETGVSCLGLVKAIYAKYGINLPMSHPGMKKVGIGVSYSDAQPGDILCYKSHVAIYAGNGMMVDATSSKGVSKRKVDKGIVTVRRIPRS